MKDKANKFSNVMFFQSLFKLLWGGFDISNLGEKKDRLYHDHYLTNVFFPFVKEVFGCLHQQVNNIFHRCANMAWMAKGIEGLLLSMLHLFISIECWWHYKQCMSPSFQHRLLQQGRICLGLEFYLVYFPYFQLICFMQLGEGFGFQWFLFLIVAYLF